MVKIFVSYSRVDKPAAEEIVKRLRRVYGYDNVWMDDNLTGGDIWWDEILDGISACDIFLYLLSNESVNSPYCQAEYTEAYRLHKRIITAQIRDRTKLTDELAERQYVDMSDWMRDTDALNLLHAAIHKQTPLAQKRVRPRYSGRTEKPYIPSEAEEQAALKAAPPDESSTLITPLIQGEQGSDSRRWLWIGIAGAIVIILIAGLALVLGSDLLGDSSDETETPDNITQNNDTPTLTETNLPTETSTDIPTETETNEPTATDSPTARNTLTNTPFPTATPTLTPTLLSNDQLILLAENGVTNNYEWQSYSQEFNGVEMVLVPAGCFMMGSNSGASDEQPVHEQCFDEPFWIDRYEVTNEQFNRLDGVASDTSNWSGNNLPRESITWFEARDFVKTEEHVCQLKLNGNMRRGVSIV